MEVWSPAFAEGARIPAIHATRRIAGGANLSFPLEWRGEPAATRSFALSVVDLHPIARGWVHWLVADIPPDMHSLPAGASGTPAMGTETVELTGSYGAPGYGGPQPPPGTGDHVYEVTLYALDTARLDLGPGADLAAFSAAVGPHVMTQAATRGTFSA
jgi:Raf kinase inhibitor-like YbhB/YbcL family protein